ncbi:pentapeptide repeat-containing protein [Leptolyngbya sp. FACHB-711]|uniref:pentapeptide repeat-containing protein n=1 Tax=unclassified Leptolyngbya TaxID=2650499 RepID=UPI00168272B6|nr:pentapeptide repeat-containing protein [Leptolyngbya sp. FACHB-711]MBD1848590.1 pentapeptide repeat-containing protein [Cyanobacteria bacterium FACHB-502]MBD2025387.1 pentapeptide repeat-containing protein [Leptolyngbya sp. FACHB-711]
MYAWLCRLRFLQKENFFASVVCGVVLSLSLLCLSGLLPSSALAEDYNREFLVNRDFSGKDLTDSSFTKANMRGSNLSNTNLQGVSFFGANLEDANLESANLSTATLDSARMVGANLKNAILEGAFAFNTKFNNAVIEGADFTDVLLREDMQDILCQTASGTNPTTGRETRETLGC